MVFSFDNTEKAQKMLDSLRREAGQTIYSVFHQCCALLKIKLSQSEGAHLTPMALERRCEKIALTKIKFLVSSQVRSAFDRYIIRRKENGEKVTTAEALKFTIYSRKL